MNKKTKNIFFISIPLLIISFLSIYFIFFNNGTQKKFNVDFLNANEKWADSILASMTIEEKIGQIVMLNGFVPNNSDSILYYIDNYNIGGVFPICSTFISIIDQVT